MVEVNDLPMHPSVVVEVIIPEVWIGLHGQFYTTGAPGEIGDVWLVKIESAIIVGKTL